MLFGRNKIEEDLEKIRNANLPSEKLPVEKKLNLEKNDLLAMALALLSLILPYIISFIGIIAFLVFLFYKFIL